MLLQVQSVIEINVANAASDSDRQQQAADNEDVDVYPVSRSEPQHADDRQQNKQNHEFDLLADDDGIVTDPEDQKDEVDDLDHEVIQVLEEEVVDDIGEEEEDEVVFLGCFPGWFWSANRQVTSDKDT